VNGLRRTRILMWPLLAVLAAPAAAAAAPGDPYVVYTANNYADGAVILRWDSASGSLVEITRNGPLGNLFRAPFDVAVEANGNLLVADLGAPCTPTEPRCAEDGRIIRVNPVTGRQSLLAAGAPLVDPAGLALAPNGALYVADNHEADDDGAVFRVNRVTGAKTLISEGGQLDLPFGILVDRDGSLVLSNRVVPGGCGPAGTGRLVRVQPGDGSQQLVSEAGLFGYPVGVALDAAGGIVVANECGNSGLVRVLSDLTQGVLTPNTPDDVLVTPERLALEPAGDFLVSDWRLGDGDGGIVKVDAETGAQSVLAHGNLFNHPIGIATVVNRPPSAALTLAPRLVAAGKPVRLDASASRDPEGLRLLYEWDLNGDGVFERGTGVVSRATRAWMRDRVVRVSVRVNDPHGGRAVAQSSVHVDGSTPQITGVRLGSSVLGANRRRRSTKLAFRLSEPAEVSVTIERARLGRRSREGSPCRRRARRGSRCVRWRQVAVLSKAGRLGANRLRIRARGLRPGRYRLLIDATDAVGHEAVRRKVEFRVAPY
jgi:DNA-binding beta-propeller fold protein YncE